MRRRPSLLLLNSLFRDLAMSKWKEMPSRHRTRPFLYSYGSKRKSCENPVSIVSTEYGLLKHARFCTNLIDSSVSAASISASNININGADEEKRLNHLQVDIISRQNIKPASPTPHHLRNYDVSIFDIISTHIYLPFVYFYHKGSSHPFHHDLISQRFQLLRQSLSQTLTKFYPFAGRIQGERHIDYDDSGAYYIEAKVNGHRTLTEFLRDPDNNSIHQLLPFHPRSDKLLSQTYVVMIQVTAFSCGGIAIGLYTSHKIIDATSHMTFLKAWAATARGHPELICPSFTSPSIFLPNLPYPPEAGLALMPFFSNQNKCVMKRFVFPKSSLVALKKKAGESSSRVMALTGFIWKCVIAASKSRSDGIPRKTYNLMLPVNIRRRSCSPPLPIYSIGNLFLLTIAECCVNENQDVGLSSIVEILRNARDKIDGEFIERMTREEGNMKVGEYLNEMNRFHSDQNVEYIVVSSLCNSGIYEADFGWGKPIWASFGNAGADIPHLRNMVYLMDTRSGDGIEAWVSLRERDMYIFVKNPELLDVAFVSPSPIDYYYVS